MGVTLEQRPGGEVRIETGRGIVVELGPGDKRNRQVKFRATHADLKELVTGWLDTEGSPAEMVALVERAFAERFEVAYRVEVRRKDGADPATPIGDVGNREKVRDLVLVAPSAEAAVGSTTSSTPPPAQEPAGSAASPPPPADPGSEPGEGPRGPENGSGGPGPRVAEGKAWEEHNSDGSPNVGSWHVLAAAGMVDLAVELLTARAAELETAGQPFEFPPAPAKVKNLARTLLHVADHVQATARSDGHVSRGDSSHTRARGVVRTALALYPVPWDGDAEARAVWADTLGEYAAGLLRIAVGLAYSS